MRRILIYGQLPPPFHGTNIMTRVFLKALRELGFEAEISSKQFSRSIEEVNRLKPAKVGRYIGFFLKFLRDLRISQTDLVVYFLSSRRMGLMAELPFVLWAQIFHVPYVLYLHTRGYGKLYSRSLLFRGILRQIFRPALACFILGDRLRQDIGVFFPGKTYILPNCIDGPEPLGRAPVPSKAQVLFLSNINESKGIRTLMAAIPQVIGSSPDVLFVLAGPWQDRSVEKEVLEFVERRGIRESVRWTGPVFGKDKADLLASSDIFVFPSHYPLEAMSLVVLEAMQAGLPVIASDIGSLPEVVVDGKTGFVIPPQDPERLSEKIVRLVKEPELRRRMGQESRQRFLAYFSFAVYKKRVGQILEELCFLPPDERA
jgi:glycosyltransferase involved in cell wall biosynthesis